MNLWIYNFGVPMALTEPQLNFSKRLKSVSKLNASSKVKVSSELQIAKDQPTSENSKVYLNPNLTQYKPSHRRQIFISSDLMSTGVTSVNAEASLSSLWNLFKQKKYRHIPVVDDNQHLIGIVSDRDFFTQLSVDNANIRKIVKNQTVKQFMQKTVLASNQNTPLEEICKLMFNYHIGAIPVVNKSHNVVGIITRSDILHAMIKNKPFELWI